MSSVLDRITASKRAEIAERKANRSLEELLRLAGQRRPSGFVQALTAPGIRIIAEIKYRSPSHGKFRCQANPVEVARAYARGGAAAISVLTDELFFGGRPEFLTEVYESLQAAETALPLLRKDFLLERYQVAEAAALGASACLLIVACLGRQRLEELADFAGELGLAALVEVHDEPELETAVEAGARLIGVNNRDLSTFRTSVDTSFRLARILEGESGCVLVAESGLSDPAQLLELHDAGFEAFLIGGSLMDSEHPGAALERLLDGATE